MRCLSLVFQIRFKKALFTSKPEYDVKNIVLICHKCQYKLAYSQKIPQFAGSFGIMLKQSAKAKYRLFVVLFALFVHEFSQSAH